jgi:hypothetical protein
LEQRGAEREELGVSMLEKQVDSTWSRQSSPEHRPKKLPTLGEALIDALDEPPELALVLHERVKAAHRTLPAMGDDGRDSDYSQDPVVLELIQDLHPLKVALTPAKTRELIALFRCLHVEHVYWHRDFLPYQRNQKLLIRKGNAEFEKLAKRAERARVAISGVVGALNVLGVASRSVSIEPHQYLLDALSEVSECLNAGSVREAGEYLKEESQRFLSKSQSRNPTDDATWRLFEFFRSVGIGMNKATKLVENIGHLAWGWRLRDLNAPRSETVHKRIKRLQRQRYGKKVLKNRI